MSFHVGCASAGTDAAEFIFYEEFADERLAEAGHKKSALDLAFLETGRT